MKIGRADKVILFLLVLALFFGAKYIVQHRPGYGAIDYANKEIPSQFLFTDREEIPDNYRVAADYSDIQQVGIMFSDTFYCNTLERDADIVKYYEHTEGYGITGGWWSRFAAVCGDEYLVVYRADHLGEVIYGPFSLEREAL